MFEGEGRVGEPLTSEGMILAYRERDHVQTRGSDHVLR